MVINQVKPSDQCVSITQAAALLYVNRATIRRWIKEGKLKGDQIGRTTLIIKEDVLALGRQRGLHDF